MPQHLKLGELGEDIACRFLKEKGFEIITRNYRKPWGELDIVAKNLGILHFVEVKSLATTLPVPHETSFSPEDAVDIQKSKRLMRVIKSYLSEKGEKYLKKGNWQFDIIALWIDRDTKGARIKFIEDFFLEE